MGRVKGSADRLEEAVKTGQMNDRMSVELLIIAYSGEKERRA